MNLSENGRNIIKKFEGFSATPYPDAQGFSIGYGHFIKPNEILTRVTREQAEVLLTADVASAESSVKTLVKKPLTPNQFDALVSLVYNIGHGNFAKSTLLKKINLGDYAGAAQQFPEWKKSQGVILPALVARRHSEQKLFETA